MKCPQCRHQQSYRSDRRCQQCGYHHALDPKKDSFNDGKMLALIDKLSDQGQLAFTETQLVLQVARQRLAVGWLSFAFTLPVAMIVAGVAYSNGNSSAFSLFSGGLTLIIGTIALSLLLNNRQQGTASYLDAQTMVRRYLAQHPHPQLATGNAFADANPPAHAGPAIAEHILVVPRADLVDSLIRNRFHLLHKAVVVSAEGYPAAVMQQCHSWLEQYPTLPIQVLHDAGPVGEHYLANLCGQPLWQAYRDRLQDLGLHNRHLQRQPLATQTWISPEGQLRLSTNPAAQTRRNARLPVDFLSPQVMPGALSSLLVNGVLTIPQENGDYG